MTPKLLIFDCDGVLVDSEPLAMRALLETIADAGLDIGPARAYERFLGRDMASITEVLSEEFGVDLTHDALDEMRRRLFESFRRELKPIPGVTDALDAIALPRCVASSSQIERVRLALDVTGLRSYFEPNIFCASMVERGKPEPDLFLHAAQEMGVAPSGCVVIEDSPSGVIAAQRAGMAVLAFTGGTHADRGEHREALHLLKPSLIFDDMKRLPEHLKMLRRVGVSV